MAMSEWRARILRQVANVESGELSTRRLCEVSAAATGTTGVGIMLLLDGLPCGSLGATDGVSALVEQLQYTLGEGPGVEAAVRGWPVIEPDIAHPTTRQWIAFAGPALEAGVRAVFAFPLRVGAARLGALDLYRDQPGSLTDAQHVEALLLADLVAAGVLAFQAGAPPGTIARELAAGADFQYVVHQASGMVAAQLGISVHLALVRLRAYAFGNERPLTAVADDVIARRLRFDDERLGP